MQALDWVINNIHISVWYALAGLFYLGLTISAAIHALLNKEKEGSAVAWLGLILLSPGIGVILYWLLGINRIKRRAKREFPEAEPKPVASVQSLSATNHVNHQWRTLMHAGHSIHHDNYLKGNQLTPLINGEGAYPLMLRAIAGANHSIILSSYIFDYDDIGKQFVLALGAAHKRGVSIRVMIDGIGVGYSLSWIKTDRALRRLNIKTARFLPTLSRKGTRFINLRNHRKILSVDGKIAFIGGINIRDNNLDAQFRITTKTRHATRDIHFQITGPVIDQINRLFIEDWKFACNESLILPTWQGAPPGTTICRTLPDGPDDNYQKLPLTLASAINAAQYSIRVVTPYFLPGTILSQSLEVAALRGVKVEVLVPRNSNIKPVDWALSANLPNLLTKGIRVYFSPAPFDHSKLFMIDDGWCLLGSSNWDARSLELNFEVNLECFDKVLNATLTTIFNEKLSLARQANHKDTASVPAQLRNSFSRLFSPYL